MCEKHPSAIQDVSYKLKLSIWEVFKQKMQNTILKSVSFRSGSFRFV